MPNKNGTARGSDTVSAGQQSPTGIPPAAEKRGYLTTGEARSELQSIDRDPFKGFRKGGRVHRTGIYRLHKGERVIPARGRRRGRR